MRAARFGGGLEAEAATGSCIIIRTTTPAGQCQFLLNHQIVLMRPHLARSIGCVLGILLSGGLLVGSLVLFGLNLTSSSPNPPPESRETV